MGPRMNFSANRDELSSNASSPRVLLVDDERDILPEYQEFFEFAGFNTLTCEDAVEAVDLVLNMPDIAVVVTDLRMARLDAGSMIRVLRSAIPAERRVEFIILTGDASTQLMVDISDVPVFLKPADTDALVAAIRAALMRP